MGKGESFFNALKVGDFCDGCLGDRLTARARVSITNSSAAVVRASFVVGAKIEGGAGKLKRNTSLTRSSECSDANPVSSVNALGEQAEETIPFLGFIVYDQ